MCAGGPGRQHRDVPAGGAVRRIRYCTTTRGSAMERTKFQLDESQIPHTWYNIAADLPGAPMAPALNPATGKPLTRDEMGATMPEPIIDQELSTERDIEIPDAVRQLYT